jgi:prepilin-type processing-associated H-X9-DG protein
MKSTLAITLVLTLATGVFAQPKPDKPALPPDLAAVPNDAFAFAHVKLADLWKNEALKDVRAILEKAGAKAIEAFDNRFTPAPSSIDRITAYMPTPDFENGPRSFDFVFILTVNKPFDRDKCLKQLGKTQARKGRLGGFVVDEDETIAVRFIDEKTIAFGTPQAIQHMVDVAPPQKPGPLTPGLELAAGRQPIVAALNVTAVPAEYIDEALLRQIPEQLHPLFRAQSLTLSMDLEGDGHIHAQVSYADGKTADAAEKALGIAIEMAKALIADTRKELMNNVFGDGKDPKIEDLPIAAASLLGLGALQHAEDILKTNPVKRSGDALTATIALPPQFKSLIGTAGVAASMMAPAVGKLKDQAARAKGANNLKQIGLALHNYHDTIGSFPSAAAVDKKGKPQLSWRVLILPYIEQDNLYRQFKLDEPWDSEHNKKLIDQMPPTYALPNKMSKPGHTHYRGFVGNGAFWDWIQGTEFAKITDGTSNTIMVVEAEEGVPWTKPDEFEFDPTKDLPKLGKAFKGGFHVLFCDGSVRFMRDSFPPQTLKALITKDGGEVIND